MLKDEVQEAAFKAERRKGIGGSDFEDILAPLTPAPGEVTYGCQRRCWYEKRGQEPDYAEEVSGAMRRGSRLEEVAAKMYSEMTGRRVRRARPLTQAMRAKLPAWYVGHIDRVASPTNPQRRPGVLEIKTFGERAWKRLLAGGLNQSHLAQVHHYLMGTGYDWADIFAYWPDGDAARIYPVARDETLIDLMIQAGNRFWRMVENGPAPERLDPKDRRCKRCVFRATCQGTALLETAAEADPDLQREEDPNFVQLLRDERDAADLVAEAEAVLELCRGKVRIALGERQAVETTGFRVYWRTQSSKRIDISLLRKEKPEVVEQYERTIVTRPLRIVAV